MSKTENVRDVLDRMNKLLNLRNQVSMDGGELQKRNDILDKQRSIAKAHTELVDLVYENKKYKKALEVLSSEIDRNKSSWDFDLIYDTLDKATK